MTEAVFNRNGNPMKNILLGLLLANVLLLAWHRWIAPEEIEAIDTRTTVPTLILMSGRQGPREAPALLQDAALETARQCLRVGPLVDSEQANAVAHQLAGAGYSVSQTSREGRAWVGHWVQVENLASRELAARVLRTLTEGGLSDAYIVESDQVRKVSLGVFRDRERAERTAARAIALGVEATISDRFRPATEYWLEVVSDRGVIDLTEFQLDTSQILRGERVSCP